MSDAKKKSDVFEDLVNPDVPQNANALPFSLNVMVRGTRAKSSAEMEEREREYLNTNWLPIPFFDSEDQELPTVPSDPKERAALDADFRERFGCTLEDWMEFNRRDERDPTFKRRET